MADDHLRVNVRTAYVGLAVLVLGFLGFGAFVVWPLGLYGDRLTWSLVLTAIAVLLVRWHLALGPEVGRAVVVMPVVMAFTAFGPGSAALVAATSSAYRSWRGGGVMRAAQGAAGAVIGVGVLFAIYWLAIGEFAFGDGLGVLIFQGGSLAAARVIAAVLFGGLAFAILSESLDPLGSLRLDAAPAILAMVGLSTILALAYPVLGAAAIILLAPIGALVWAGAVALRASSLATYVSVYHKLTSIVVGGVTMALILAVGAIGVFFYRDYTEMVIGRYSALAEGLTASFAETVAEGGSAVSPTLSMQVRRSFEDDPGLAYAILTFGPERGAVLSHVKPYAEDFIGDVRIDLSEIGNAGRHRRAWRAGRSQLSVENVTVAIQSAEGQTLGMIHLGVDRAFVNSKLRQLGLEIGRAHV